MNNAGIRDEARYNLGNNLFCEKWLMAMVSILVASLVLSALSFTFVGSLIVMGPLMVGLSGAFLNASRYDKAVDLGEMFSLAFSQNFVRNMVLGILESIFISLWSLLFVIPGIMKAYSYSMAMFIAHDHPEYDWKRCLDESTAMMNGHRMDLFLLDLSFIGWMILGSLACGIGTLWVAPYQFQSRVVFYRRMVNG